MTRLRILFAWLALLALPLQGFAAASMLFCGGHGEAGGPAAAHVATMQHVHAQPTAPEGGHFHHHQHASADEAGASHAATHDLGKADSGHRCAVCASCCNFAAVASAAAVMEPAATPQADLPPAVLRVPTRATLVPDKPPRA